MNDKFKYYCRFFNTKPKIMREILHRYFGTPAHIREISFQEYYARRDGRLFNGREPRLYIDICMDLLLKHKSKYEKLLEIHESGLFPNILDSDEERRDENQEVIASLFAFWEKDLAAKRMCIAGAKRIYEYAPEIHEER
mgnify:CR=1 FL=1